MNKQYLAETQREISEWPDVSMTQEAGGKHDRVILHYQGESRIVVVSNSPSDVRGIKNHVSLVRRILKDMGAKKTVAPVSQIHRERNKPERISVPSMPAPVRENPFLKLAEAPMTNTNKIEAIFASIEQLRYAEMLEFAAILSDTAVDSKMRRSHITDWANTLQSAATNVREHRA